MSELEIYNWGKSDDFSENLPETKELNSEDWAYTAAGNLIVVTALVD